jgi:hypothetical protein
MPRFQELEPPAHSIAPKEVRPALEAVLTRETVDTALDKARKRREVTPKEAAIVHALGYSEKQRINF